MLHLTEEERVIDDYECFDLIKTLVNDYGYSEKKAIQIVIAMYLEDLLNK